MPNLDEAAIRHVADLARLDIRDADIQRMAEHLSRVLGYVEQLNELDTTDTVPTAHPLAISNVFRDDEVRPSCDPQQALANAPHRRDDFFAVPKVLDQEGA